MPYKPTSKQSIESKKESDREYNHRRPQRHKIYNTAGGRNYENIRSGVIRYARSV
ncbi:MAG: hypothetical protein IJ587_13165 [Synergistaceae bacterium]|nr:hypothetical protein [Synergistaceae bacterium]